MLKKFWTNTMVADLHRTITFYRDVLGFEHVMSVPAASEEVLFQYDPARPLVYTLLKQGEIELMFQERESLKENVPAFGPAPEIGATMTFYFRVEDVDAVAAKVREHCVIVRGLHDTFYGMREIYVRDPDGYVLGFSQEIR
jgi:catechol 2,3-dioxygenase-like lactoylglutathione lyase family enzyme